MESYIDEEGIQRCDDCEDEIDTCTCVCLYCGDHFYDCVCDEE